MADNPIGTIIGDETFNAQDVASKAFMQNLPPNYKNLPLDQQQSLMADLNKLMAEVVGIILSRHVLVWESISFDPSSISGPGLDRPYPSVAQQFDEGGTHVAYWGKTGTGIRDWKSLGGGGGDGKIKTSEDDTHPDYASGKMVSSDGSAIIEEITVGGVTKMDIRPVSAVGEGNYTTAYFVDFTALPAQNLLTGGDGDKTIDGRSWKLSNSVNLATAYINDGTHAGLYLKCNNNFSQNYLTSLTGGAVHSDIESLAPLIAASTSRYHVKEVWIWFMWTMPHTPNADAEEGMVGALYNYKAYASDQLCRLFCGTHWYEGALGGQYVVLDVYDKALSSAALPLPMTYDVFAIRIRDMQLDAFTGKSVGGAFPSRSNLTWRSRTLMTNEGINSSQIIGMLTYDNFRAWMSVISGNTAGNADVLLKQLKIDYQITGMSSGSSGGDEEFYVVNIVGGIISGFGTHRNLLVEGGGTLVGIDATGVPEGASINLTFAEATNITAMAAGAAQQIKLPWLTPGSAPENAQVEADAFVRLQNRSDKIPAFWCYIGGTI